MFNSIIYFIYVLLFGSVTSDLLTPTSNKIGLDNEGNEVKPKYRYSWTAALQYKDAHACSGVFLMGNIVLTAASCIQGVPGDWIASNKRHEIDLTPEKEKSKSLKVTSFITHPQYEVSTKAFDAAIWKLDGPVGSAPFLKIDDGRWSNAGDFLLTTIGWGIPPHLSKLQKEIEVSIIRGSKCKTLNENLDNVSQFCVAYPQGATEYCYYEPGSPIIIKKNGELILVGIASSTTCITNDHPGIYIRMGALTKFIKATVARLSPIPIADNAVSLKSFN